MSIEHTCVYEEDIRRLEGYPVSKGNILLYGSSFFTNWGYDRAAKQLSHASGGKYEVINHGFGGATVDWLLYYYNRLVRPYAPRQMIWRGGVNDVFRGLDAYEAWLITKRVFQWYLADFPDSEIGILGIFDFKSITPETGKAFQQYNKYCKEYAAQTPRAHYIDINGFFYSCAEDIGKREKLRDVFVGDGLHLTNAGYAEMAPYFAGKLQEAGF